MFLYDMDFPGGSDSKESVYNAGDLGSIPGLGRFPGEGNGNPLQYSCLENPMDGGAWCFYVEDHVICKQWEFYIFFSNLDSFDFFFFSYCCGLNFQN